MCPAFRLDTVLSHLLEPVVSNGGRGVQACFKIARLYQVPLALGGPKKSILEQTVRGRYKKLDGEATATTWNESGAPERGPWGGRLNFSRALWTVDQEKRTLVGETGMSWSEVELSTI